MTTPVPKAPSPWWRRWFAIGFTLATAVGGMAGSGDPAIGNTTYIYAHCPECHGNNALGNHKVSAPKIAGLEEWYIINQLTKFRTGLRGANRSDETGKTMAPLSRMLRDEQAIAHLAAHLSRLEGEPVHQLRGGHPRRGRDAYVARCLPCHGESAEGNPLLQSPGLTAMHDWYIYNQLVKFSSGSRGGHPDDFEGSQMRAIAREIPDRQTMKDITAYIRSLKP